MTTSQHASSSTYLPALKSIWSSRNDHYLDSFQLSQLLCVCIALLAGLVRLSFHDAGTWSQSARNGGPDGEMKIRTTTKIKKS